MKIKRLTAALAVAAMAAGFTLASPMLSAQANPVSPEPYHVDDITATATAGIDNPINLVDALAAADPAATQPTALGGAYGQNVVVGFSGNPTTSVADNMGYLTINTTAQPQYYQNWKCDNPQIWTAIPTSANDKPVTSTGSLGSVSCDMTADGKGVIVYHPSPVLGVNGNATVYLSYELYGNLLPAWDLNGSNGVTPSNNPEFWGYIKVTVTQQPATGCGTGATLTVDQQAWGKYDDAVSPKIEMVKPNILTSMNQKGKIPSADAANWAVLWINTATSNDLTLSQTAVESLISWTAGKGTSVVFNAPQFWSGTADFSYAVSKFTPATATTLAKATGDPIVGCLHVIIRPTLTAPDPIVSDPGAPVTIPLLGTGSLPIIGSKYFNNANCVFASNNKAKDTSVGLITNKGKDKNPIFTPNADFTGSVDLLCTVDDAWGTTSNQVTVTIQVGAVPAPADTSTAAPVAPSCTTPGCDKLVSTGGSLATPMSSGLAAVVLLVAAGAGILVVRRRTSLAG